MQEYINTTEFKISERTAVTFGKFDGLHKGHQKLLKALAEHKKAGMKTAVFTFHVSPVSRTTDCDVKYLTTDIEKRELLKQYGIDYYIEYPFTDEVMHTAPEAFISEVICKKLNAGYIAAGADFCFGYQRRGNVEMLEKMSEKYGYDLDIIEKVRYEGEIISSTYIRNELLKGNIEKVNAMLNRPYSIEADVVHGNEIGRTIGFATANLEICSDKAVPPRGVYYVKAYLEGEVYNGMANVGLRPTIYNDTSKSHLLLEIHLLQYNQMCYGKRIKAEFMHFERPEVRFGGLSELKEQLKSDLCECGKYFSCK